MDSQEILKSLSNLEQKLQGIESAKQQVERTVAAYDGAKAQLTALTNDFADIYQTLNGILDNVKNSQEFVKGEVVQEADAIFTELRSRIDTIDQATDKIKQNFSEACEKSVKAYSESLEKTHKDQKEAYGLILTKVKEDTEKEITKSSEVLANIKKSIDDKQTQFETALNTSLENKKTVLEQIKTEFATSIERYITSMREVQAELVSILERYRSLTSEIEGMFQSVMSEIHRLHSGMEQFHNEQMQMGSNLDAKLANGFAQLLNANAKSQKWIVILAIGLVISIIINILAVAKVI